MSAIPHGPPAVAAELLAALPDAYRAVRARSEWTTPAWRRAGIALVATTLCLGGALGAYIHIHGPAPGSCRQGASWILGGRLSATSAHPAVEVPSFCMDRYEVSVADYQGCSQRGACKPLTGTTFIPGADASTYTPWDRFCNTPDPAKKRMDHPVNCVSFADAEAYCADRGGRLPSEAQWEYAAVGSTGNRYPWGNEEPTGDLVNYCDETCKQAFLDAGMRAPLSLPGNDGWATTAPVHTFERGRSKTSGIYNLAGNVYEWTRIEGPNGEQLAVLRGGSWLDSKIDFLASRTRDEREKISRLAGVGLRCVYDVERK